MSSSSARRPAPSVVTAGTSAASVCFCALSRWQWVGFMLCDHLIKWANVCATAVLTFKPVYKVSPPWGALKATRSRPQLKQTLEVTWTCSPCGHDASTWGFKGSQLIPRPIYKWLRLIFFIFLIWILKPLAERGPKNRLSLSWLHVGVPPRHLFLGNHSPLPKTPLW